MSSSHLVIFNPRAARASLLGPGGLTRLLDRRGLDFELVATGTAEEARERASDGAAEGRVVVAAGGDGTAHVVLNGILRSGRPAPVLGLLPLGTGNDAAGMLGGAARDLGSALDLLARGRTRPIDVGHACGEAFLNGLGVGFDAAVVRRRAERGARTYVWTVFRTLFDYRPRRYRVSWPGGGFDGTALMIAAMNGRSEGGGFRIAPSARIDDGALDICWIDPVGPGGFFRYVWAVRRGTHERIPVFRSWRVDRLRVESEAAIRYHLDGEYRELPEGEPLEVEVDSGRVRLVG